MSPLSFLTTLRRTSLLRPLIIDLSFERLYFGYPILSITLELKIIPIPLSQKAMKTLKNTLLIFLLLVSTYACKSRQSNTSPEASSYFVVGQGGGFAGSYEQFKIYDNGEIEFYDFKENTYVPIKKVKAAEVSDFFTRITELNLAEADVHSPGNMSQYIELKDESGNENKLIWAMQGNAIKPAILSFFEDSFSFAQNLKAKND
jgi:hypothetical protein